MRSLSELVTDEGLHAARELTLSQGLREVGGVERVLASLAVAQQAKALSSPIHCSSQWNPLNGTFTYHTHTVVDDFSASNLGLVARLFFDAYSLEKQDWYSQFVGGDNQPLPAGVDAFADEVPRSFQLGQGYFDFGVPRLRRYQTLIALRHDEADTASVVLRSIDHHFEVQRPSKKVYLLAPTGDYFTVADGKLHWHHICTVSGISLLPGASDKHFMNLLRYLKLDSKERRTYLEEAQSFITFASQL